MAKIDNEKFKNLRDKYKLYRSILDQANHTNPMKFRTDNTVNEHAGDLYSLIKEINETGLYSSNLNNFYEIVYNVTKQLGLNLLRKNHYYLFEGKEMTSIPTNLSDIEEVTISEIEIRKSIDYLTECLAYVKKLNSPFQQMFIEQIYHNITEAYHVLGEDENYLKWVDLGAKNNDIRSICQLIDYYCSLDEFYYIKLMEYYESLKVASKLILDKQKQAGVNSYLVDIENRKAKSFKALEERTFFEMNESPILTALKNIIQTLLKHSYYDEALQIAYTLKTDYIEFAFWDSRYEKEIENNIKVWEKYISINKNIVAPSNDVLKLYFSDNTISIMQDDIKIFIGTSLYVFNTLNQSTEFTLDYSPAILPLFKALEYILYKLTLTGFYEYITKHHDHYSRISAPKSIYNREDNRFYLPSHFDLGTGLSILCKPLIINGKNEGIIPNTGVEDYFVSNGIDHPKKKIIDFCNDVQKCRVNRNITAHKERVNRTMAEESKTMILETIKIIERAYQDFGKILQ